jgi:hypothetical protein
MGRVNLFDIGKAFYQRSRRDPQSRIKEEAYKVSRELWEKHKTKKELLSIIARLKDLERKSPGVRVSQAEKAERAVKSGEYFVSVPHEISHRYNEQPGRVYIMTSESRPGECKLGATTMTMFQRCLAYHKKFGYRVTDVFAFETDTPFGLERLVADRISELRVAGNVSGDSNEWYRIEPNLLRSVIISVAREAS